jgi:hypothetical protein
VTTGPVAIAELDHMQIPGHLINCGWRRLIAIGTEDLLTAPSRRGRSGVYQVKTRAHR